MLISEAQAIYVGSDAVAAIYLGSEQVWFSELVVDAAPVSIDVAGTPGTATVEAVVDAAPVTVDITPESASASLQGTITATADAVSITVEPSAATITIVEPTPISITALPVSVSVSAEEATGYAELLIAANSVETPTIQLRAVAYGLVDTPIEFPPGGLIDPLTRSYLLTPVEEGS